MLGSWQEARMNHREHRERRDSTELESLKLSGRQVGLPLNFNVRVLKDGLQRLVNGFAR